MAMLPSDEMGAVPSVEGLLDESDRLIDKTRQLAATAEELAKAQSALTRKHHGLMKEIALRRGRTERSPNELKRARQTRPLVRTNK